MSYNDSSDVEATIIGTPAPPAASPGLTRVEGIASAPQTAGQGNLNSPATPTITAGTTGVQAGPPTLSTATPIQPVAAPRIAGKQMVPPTPPEVQTASQLTQPANAPQALQGISTMMQPS